MRRQPLIRFVLPPTFGQLQQRRQVFVMRRGQRRRVDRAVQKSIADLQRSREQRDYLGREHLGRSQLPLRQRPRAAQRMVDALLMARVGKAVVGRIPVMRHPARPIPTDDLGQHTGAAAAVNGVGGGAVVADPGMQPGQLPTYPPAGLVRRQVRRSLQAVADLRIDRLEPAAGAQHDLGTGAAADADAKERRQRAGDLAVGQARPLVQIDDGRLRIGAQLALRGAGGITGLVGMPAAIGLAAAATVAAVDRELADDRPARDFRLVLHIDVRWDNVVATVATAWRQRGIVGLIDLRRWRRWPMRVLAVLRAGFAAGLLGMRLGGAACERSRLTFGGAFGGFETLLQVADGLLQLRDEAVALGQLLAEALVFGLQFTQDGCVHADLGSTRSRQLTVIIEDFARNGNMALNKHPVADGPPRRAARGRSE